MKLCPILNQPVPSQCPRGDCGPCQEDLEERAALIEFGGMNLDCASSEKLAREQLQNSLPGQREMLQSA